MKGIAQRSLWISIPACLALMLAVGLRTSAAVSPERALWVWDAAPLLKDARARTTFLDFCHARRISTAWIQAGAGERSALHDALAWTRLLGEAHERGVRIHALDGAPEYARRSGHAKVLNLVDAVIAFNRTAPASSRFDGIHLDNEPYLLAEWRDLTARERLLGDYLDLTARVQMLVREAGGMEFGVDIPFWWQSVDDKTKEAIGVVTFNGARKAASYHLLDFVDNVGIMDYRNTAAGRDGLIAHAADLLQYSDAARARLFVGVETIQTTPEPYWFLTGISSKKFTRELRKSPAVVGRRDLSVVNDGELVHVGLPSSGRDAETVLSQLARQLEAQPMNAQGRRTLDAAQRALREEGEWRSLTVDPIVDEKGRAYGGIRAIRTMLPKITFAGRSNEEMERELSAAEEAFAAHRNYAGIAIHHYDSYRARFDQQ